jgi:hypothetical protein
MALTRNEAYNALADIWEAMELNWEKHGWIKGNLGKESTGFCMMGDWYKATGLNGQGWNTELLTQVFRSTVGEAVDTLYPNGGPFTTVEMWNDTVAASLEDVKLVTKHAVFSMLDAMEFDGE